MKASAINNELELALNILLPLYEKCAGYTHMTEEQARLKRIMMSIIALDFDTCGLFAD